MDSPIISSKILLLKTLSTESISITWELVENSVSGALAHLSEALWLGQVCMRFVSTVESEQHGSV